MHGVAYMLSFHAAKPHFYCGFTACLYMCRKAFLYEMTHLYYHFFAIPLFLPIDTRRQPEKTVISIRLNEKPSIGTIKMSTMKSFDFSADKFWSGRRESNPRKSAWEADAIPLGDSRIYIDFSLKIAVSNNIFTI